MKTFDDLKAIISKLRSPEGCPWDRKQTHESLLPFLMEESGEVFDAVMKNDQLHLKEELGDLLLQIMLHAEIANEQKAFSINDVINDICEKLIRRHPHVFGEETVENSDEVLVLWEKVKKEEKANPDKKEFILDKVPKNFSPLLRSDKLQKEAAKTGFDWPESKMIIDKIHEELEEVKEAVNSGSKKDIEHEIGDLIFSVVNLGRFLKIKSDAALAKTNHRFYERFTYIEKKVRESGKRFEDFTLEQLDAFWDEAKKML